MNRRFWMSAQRREEAIIMGCTNLGVRIEIRFNNIAVECASFKPEDMKNIRPWVRAKVMEWGLHSPKVKPQFVVV